MCQSVRTKYKSVKLCWMMTIGVSTADLSWIFHKTATLWVPKHFRSIRKLFEIHIKKQHWVGRIKLKRGWHANRKVRRTLLCHVYFCGKHFQLRKRNRAVAVILCSAHWNCWNWNWNKNLCTLTSCVALVGNDKQVLKDFQILLSELFSTACENKHALFTLCCKSVRMRFLYRDNRSFHRKPNFPETTVA